MAQKRIIGVLLFILSATALFAQHTWLIKGDIRDENNKAMEFVHINVVGSKQGIASKPDGSFEISVSEASAVELEFSFVGYLSVKQRVTPQTALQPLHIRLQLDENELGTVTVSKNSDKEQIGVRLSPRLVSLLPGATLSGVEATIKTLPGVSSTSELSSQYNVRGGNFDENLTYVNGMPVYKPLLIRSGQQEGFSFINSDLVSGIDFSSGGFSAEYGDKMSSVLDIRYRTPQAFAATASASLMGANAHVEGYSKKARVSHITGVRYKNNSLILSTLEEKGQYHPEFFDVQSNIIWRPTDFWTFNVLGYLSRNTYRFNPQSQETTFGNDAQILKLYVDFQGQEVDFFDTYYGAFNAHWRPNERLRLSFSAGNNYSNEGETFDIISAYNLNDAMVDSEGKKLNDSTKTLAAGGSLRHARNFLTSNITDIQHTGQWRAENQNIKWGAGAQLYRVNYSIDEWSYSDSADYALPISDTLIGMNNKVFNNLQYISGNVSGFVQDEIRFRPNTTDFSVTPGVRCSYYPSSNEVLASPRIRFGINPHWQRAVTFRLSAGLYYQPVFFKEMITMKGELIDNLKAQRSVHYVAGMDYFLRIWDRPFKFTAEYYYKDLQRIIPYTVENVKLQYHPEQTAHGYATGLDMKLNGEFVKGTESWASLSIMQTKEFIDGQGWVRRPSDQFMNLGVFFQDYLPFDNSYKMNLAMYYGTNLPTWNPAVKRTERSTQTIPSYQRVDIGFSKQIFPTKRNPDRSEKTLKNLWVSLEVFNILDIRNKISYMWVPNVSQTGYYPVPNYLTARMVNLKVSASF